MNPERFIPNDPPPGQSECHFLDDRTDETLMLIHLARVPSMGEMICFDRHIPLQYQDEYSADTIDRFAELRNRKFKVTMVRHDLRMIYRKLGGAPTTNTRVFILVREIE